MKKRIISDSCGHESRRAAKQAGTLVSLFVAFILASLTVSSVLTSHPQEPFRHIAVYQREGHFAGWPANHGIWMWGDEILVGFDAGPLDPKPSGHAIDYSVIPDQLLARSLDGGETWETERPPDLALPAAPYMTHFPDGKGRPLEDCPGGLDFQHPDFAFTARMTANPGVSRFYSSTDRGRSWAGPYRLPNFGHPGTSARTDYVVNGPHDLSLFTTLAKRDGTRGWAAMVRTRDGGRSWELVSHIGPEPTGQDYAIMPATVQLEPGVLFTVIRGRGFLETYRSLDNGHSWRPEGRPALTGKGNPASLIRLHDGRLALTYGYREKPFGIRARLSADGGRSWGEEIVLRADGDSWDLGYPRSVQRPDGRIVTIYYFNLTADAEHFIGATIWSPGTR